MRTTAHPSSNDCLLPVVHASGVTKKVAAGKAGTRKLLKLHGPALVCVRYRVDPLRLCRFTTVELVVSARLVNAQRFDRSTFGLDIPPGERALRRALLAHGARFDPRDQLWWLRGQLIRRLHLVHLVRQV